MKNKCDVWFLYSSSVYYNKIRNGYAEGLYKKAKEYNISIDIKSVNKFIVVTGDKNELYYEGILVKNLPKYVILRKYELYLGKAFEMLGVKVFNNIESMTNSRNKLKTHQLLSENGVLSPKTLYIVPTINKTNIKYDKVCKILGANKFILKWICGSKGNGVHLVDNEENFDKLVLEYNGEILCQEFIDSSYGMDIRAYVVGGKYIGAAMRKSNKSFKSNLAQGGSAIKYDYNKKIESIALLATKAVNLDICGVDILIGKDDKYYVCEVNSVPGFTSLNKTMNIDEKDIFLTLIRDKIKEEDKNEFKL